MCDFQIFSLLACIFYFGFPDSSFCKESACNERDLGLIPGSGRITGEWIGYPFQYSWASLVTQLVKNLPEMRETWVWSLGWEDPWRRERLPTPVFWSGEFHGLYGVTKSRTQRSEFHFHLIFVKTDSTTYSSFRDLSKTFCWLYLNDKILDMGAY